jgi:antitoxin (DNA-binding transcriptional repressor) of toxin-antitoxin stability system
MRRITIRDLRQRWPEAEAALQAEDEIIVTRDSKPVAKLVRVTRAEAKRPRWTPEEHRRWIKKVFGKRVFPSSDEPLAATRADRKLTSAR